MTKEEQKAYNAAYREANRVKLLAKRKEYYEANKTTFSEKAKEYQAANIEAIKANKKVYYEENKSVIRATNNKWREDNSDKMKEYDKEYHENRKPIRRIKDKERKATDPVYKLKCNIAKRIRESFRQNGTVKTKFTKDILGCTYKEFKEYIESKFEPWMTWENYGNWNGKPTDINLSWDLDHIIPLTTALTEDDVIRLNHYTNLQPLCSYTNRYIKRDKL